MRLGADALRDVPDERCDHDGDKDDDDDDSAHDEVLAHLVTCMDRSGPRIVTMETVESPLDDHGE